MTMITNSSSVPVKIHNDSLNERKAIENMLFVHDTIIRLMHPFVPFVTEEIYHILRETLDYSDQKNNSIMEAQYPSCEGLIEIDETSKRYVSEIDNVIDIITRGSSRVDLQACKLGTGRRFTTS
jgi:Valyl-tRNA synthetase